MMVAGINRASFSFDEEHNHVTERETIDRFARQVAQVLRRLEEDRSKSDKEKETGALRSVRAGEP
jgi:hypothetical protein